MTKRLEEIFSVLPRCEIFADIGCDHGYISKQMLDSGKANKVLFADISAKCLKKARFLLEDYVKSGRAEGYVSNGFSNLPDCDLALIAGMGGEEIISIISSASRLPNSLVLQPMKNSEKVRENLVKLGFRIERDYTFIADEKFYDLILAIKGKDYLTEDEILFGRTNLKEKPSAFIEKINKRKKAVLGFIENPQISKENKESFLMELERLRKLC